MQESNTTNPSNVSSRLRQLRKDMKMSQIQVAKRIGIAKNVVCYYESGDRCPSYEILCKYAALFHVTTDYLLGLEKERVLNVSDLKDEDIQVLMVLSDAFGTNGGKRKEK